MPRWVKVLLAVALGLAIGLVYGWVINPVEYVDTSPDTLRTDYKADYVLMVAEVYHAEQDIDRAAERLAMLGSEPPAQIVAQALQYAYQAGFSPADLVLLQELAGGMQTWQPPLREAP